MAASSPRQLLILGGLGVVLVGVLYYQWAPADAPPSRPRPAQSARAPKDAPIAVDPVRLDVLKRTRPEPGESERDPFTFEARRVSPTQAGGAGGPSVPVMPTPAAVPQGPAPSPPITLKFIGILNAARTSKLAVLRDVNGEVFYGRYGE